VLSFIAPSIFYFSSNKENSLREEGKFFFELQRREKEKERGRFTLFSKRKRRGTFYPVLYLAGEKRGEIINLL